MICLIPIRSGSKRLTDKNVQLLDGLPVFLYPFKTAIDSGLFERIIIASDEEYVDLVKKEVLLGKCICGQYEGIETSLYVRDKKNSRDESPLIDLVREVVKECSITDKYMCILYSTSVLTTEDQLKHAAKILTDYDCVFPVVRVNPELTTYCDYWCYKSISDEVNTKYHYCQHADAFFMFDIKTVLETGRIIQDENGYIELKDYEAQAVHTEEDFKDLEYKWRARKCMN